MKRFLCITLFLTVFFAGPVLALELGLRLVGLRPSDARSVVYPFDPELGWRTRESFSTLRSTPHYVHQNYYNSGGLPADASRLFTRRSTTTPSVALIGDSFVESYYVPYTQSFPALTEQALGTPVLNLGVSGYAPDQYLLRAQELLPQYTVSDTVVFLFGQNDAVDVLERDYQGYAKPCFPTATSTMPDNVPLVKMRDDQGATGAWAWLNRKSVVLSALRPLFFALRLGQDPKGEALRLLPEGLERAVGLIARIREIAPTSSFLVYYIPLLEELETAEIYEENYQHFLDFCSRYGLRCASAWDAFAGNRVGEHYIQGDGHLSAVGSRRVAEHLVRLLRPRN